MLAIAHAITLARQAVCGGGRAGRSGSDGRVLLCVHVGLAIAILV